MAGIVHDDEIGASWERWNCFVEVACMLYEKEKRKAEISNNNTSDHQDYDLDTKVELKILKGKRSRRVAISSENIAMIKEQYKWIFEVGETSNSSNLIGQKRRMDFSEEDDDDIEEKKKAKKIKSQPIVTTPSHSRNLRQDFKDHILAIGGNLDSLVCVIEKRLYKSDVSKELSRLSVPYGKVESKFLEESEMEHLDIPTAEIVASLIQPSLEECEITLKNWNTNNQYALVKTWNEVVLTNRLREGMVVQLWAFRRDSKLCFALVPIV